MTRTEYLNQLKHYLKRLPHTDYEEAMDYFKEYFEEVGPENEAQVIQDLGNPKEAAYEILSQLLDKKVEEECGPSTKSKHIGLDNNFSHSSRTNSVAFDYCCLGTCLSYYYFSFIQYCCYS